MSHLSDRGREGCRASSMSSKCTAHHTAVLPSHQAEGGLLSELQDALLIFSKLFSFYWKTDSYLIQYILIIVSPLSILSFFPESSLSLYPVFKPLPRI